MKILSIDNIARILKLSKWIVQDAIFKDKLSGEDHFFNTFTEEEFKERLRKYKVEKEGYSKFFVSKINISAEEYIESDSFYKPDEVADWLDISPYTLYTWKDKKKNISFYQFFGKSFSIRYQGKDILEFIKFYKQKQANK